MTTQTELQLQDQQTAAKNIIGWLGGYGKMKAMVNAKDLISFESDGNHGLSFKFSGSKGANLVKITLIYATDTYSVEFIKYRGLNCKTVSEFGDIYGDTLKSLFESETGLYLSLFGR